MQHIPNVDSHTPGFQEQARLTAAAASERKRAPEIQIVTPPSRPNTGSASLLVAAA